MQETSYKKSDAEEIIRQQTDAKERLDEIDALVE